MGMGKPTQIRIRDAKGFTSRIEAGDVAVTVPYATCVNTISGDVHVQGNVYGGVSTISGDVAWGSEEIIDVDEEEHPTASSPTSASAVAVWQEGKSWSGTACEIRNGAILLDGKELSIEISKLEILLTNAKQQPQHTITVATRCGDVEIQGSIDGTVNTISGDVVVTGTIYGDSVNTISGNRRKTPKRREPVRLHHRTDENKNEQKAKRNSGLDKRKPEREIKKEEVKAIPARPKEEEEKEAPPKDPQGKSGVCTVCLDQPSKMVFIPCGHICTCQVCAPQVDLCPVCRLVIMTKVETFVA